MAAETAQKALIQKLINGLVNVIGKECTYLNNFRKNVENVEVKISELLSVKSDVEQEVAASTRGSKVIGGNITWWKEEVSKIKDKSDIILKGRDKVESGCLKGRLNVPRRFLLSRRAAQLNADIVKVLAEGRKYAKLSHGTVPVGLLHAACLPTEELPSRIKLMEQIMEALSSDETYVIGICGIAGVGKTRLADEVKGRVLEEKSFDAAVKIDVSQVPNIADIQGVLAHSVGLELTESDEDGRARRLLSRLTDGSKNLIVLDNIWEKVELYRIGIPLKGEEKGCKVLFTTQNTNLPWIMKAEKVEVLPLSTDEARILFKKIAGKYEDDIADKDADECGGLPLAIDAVASALGNRNRAPIRQLTIRQLFLLSLNKKGYLYPCSNASDPLCFLLCTRFSNVLSFRFECPNEGKVKFFTT